MNPGDRFEKMVAATIKKFNVFSGPNAKIFQRKIYPGAKDPNGYQIDISIELMLTPELFFLIIIECKDHARLIERSYVQQFIQVRDDISAQKAIMVSTKGFSRGAIRLAESNRIALWQWAKPRFYTVLRKLPNIEEFRKRKRKDALIKSSILYFHDKGIIVKKDPLLFKPINEKKYHGLILAQISSDNSPSEDGYMDIDILSNRRKTFFMDIVNAILESKTSASHELQLYIDSQYEKIHQKSSSYTTDSKKTKEISNQEIKDSEGKENKKFPWEEEGEFTW